MFFLNQYHIFHSILVGSLVKIIRMICFVDGLRFRLKRQICFFFKYVQKNGMFRQTRLKRNMIIGGIVTVMIPFIITGTIIYVHLSGSLMEIAKEKSLHLSKDISRGLDSFLGANLRLVSSVAADSDLIQACKTGNYTIASHELNAIYKRIEWEHTTLFLTDKNGILRIDSRFPGKQGLDVSDRDYFIKAANGVANVSAPIFARKDSKNTTIIVLCAPVFEDKAFLGACGMIFTTRYFAEIISEATMDEGGYAYLLDKDGLVLVHPNTEIILKRNLFKLPATSVIESMVNSGQPGVASYTYEGKDKIAGISRVTLTGWIAAYTQTRDEIIAPVNRLLSYVLISGILFAVITIIIIVVVSGRVSLPVQQMMEAVSQVTHYSTEVIVQIGLSKKIVFANPAFERTTGIRVDDIIGTEPMLENSARIPAQDIWQELETGNAWSGQLEFNAKSSESLISLDVMIVPMRDDHGRIQGYMVIGRDVTDELMFEKRLNQAQKLEAIGTLAGGIAHDFNNILSIIFGYAELSLFSKNIDPEVERNVRQIILASQRARGLVTQILSFSRRGGC